MAHFYFDRAFSSHVASLLLAPWLFIAGGMVSHISLCANRPLALLRG